MRLDRDDTASGQVAGMPSKRQTTRFRLQPSTESDDPHDTYVRSAMYDRKLTKILV